MDTFGEWYLALMTSYLMSMLTLLNVTMMEPGLQIIVLELPHNTVQHLGLMKAMNVMKLMKVIKVMNMRI